MVLEFERESRLKSFSSLTIFWLLAVGAIGISYTATMMGFTYSSFPTTSFQLNRYLFWTVIFLIPIYASLRVYSQWTLAMGFKMRFVMGLICGTFTAMVLEAFVTSWLGGMTQIVGFEAAWNWPLCAMGAFLLAPFRFERETAVATIIIFLATLVSIWVLLPI